MRVLVNKTTKLVILFILIFGIRLSYGQSATIVGNNVVPGIWNATNYAATVSFTIAENLIGDQYAVYILINGDYGNAANNTLTTINSSGVETLYLNSSQKYKRTILVFRVRMAIIQLQDWSLRKQL